MINAEKQLIRYRVEDNCLSYNIYYVVNTSPNEVLFLENMTHKLQYLDGFGCPLLLTSQNEEMMDKQWKYFITDCGIDLDHTENIIAPMKESLPSP